MIATVGGVQFLLLLFFVYRPLLVLCGQITSWLRGGRLAPENEDWRFRFHTGASFVLSSFAFSTWRRMPDPFLLIRSDINTGRVNKIMFSRSGGPRRRRKEVV